MLFNTELAWLVELLLWRLGVLLDCGSDTDVLAPVEVPAPELAVPGPDVALLKKAAVPVAGC